ncbi:MAG: ATP-binding protein [Minwuiales bacterium]|nr:ATP-binding protein [Minwuiales bacterium]
MKVAHINVRNFRGIKTLSWRVKGDFNCIIGPGDTCKTTILSALDYALSPRTSLSFDDSDFFNQDVKQSILIQVTLTAWDEALPEIRNFFQESKFAQYKCGLDDNGPLPEPNDQIAVSISLRVDESLEPKWSVVRGLDESDEQDRKPIWAADRAVLGISRVDVYSDFHFTWGHNTILTRLSADNEGNPNAVLSELAREMRQSDISDHQSVAECQAIADTVKTESEKAGVKLAALSPKIDLQRRSMTAGALSLHEDSVPLRNKGSGTKKLIAAAMQMKLHDGKNVSLIDEIEMGLEPHRIRGLIFKLKNSQQQIFTTTHSPVVIRELNVASNELYVCKRDADGKVSLDSLGVVPDIQGPVRANAEAFLGSRIVACEGLTEIGCLRAYDVFRLDENSAPVWTLATAYFNCGGSPKIKLVCPKLVDLGYRTAVLCDNDAPEHLSAKDVEDLRGKGVHVCQWEPDNSTERQLFHDLPWQHIPDLLTTISQNHDTLELATIIDAIITAPGVAQQGLAADPHQWLDSPELRQTIGDLAHKRSWIKRIDYAEKAFRFALPSLPEGSVTKSRLNALWNWIQNE